MDVGFKSVKPKPLKGDMCPSLVLVIECAYVKLPAYFLLLSLLYL